MGVGMLGLDPPSPALLGYQQGAEAEQSALELEPIQDAGATGRRLLCYATALNLVVFFFFFF